MYIGNNGNVGIGTTSINDLNYKLFVETGIRTRRVKVDQTGWPDYVFHSTYKLPSLQDLEAYIRKNNHLPDMPSAKEVQENGLDIGDNQAALLKKIEELTLYIIEQEKTNKKQDKIIESQNREIKDLKVQNKELQDIKMDLKNIKAQLQIKSELK